MTKRNMEIKPLPQSCDKCKEPFNSNQIMTIMSASREEGAEIMIKCFACDYFHDWIFKKGDWNEE